jgi:peptidoglycan/LPS O-acetylase OafA/YrhL
VRIPDFRPDIEGLRALALAIVLLAHAGVAAAGGGYVGVDVFFVISGFLITQLLVSELDRTGRVSLTRFYARRIKRLMPQAVTAIVAVALVSSLLLPPVQADSVAADVMAAGVYAMNWHLSAEAVDYFASGAADGPLDHFWSLAVEEQFYLLWPVLLLAVGRRRRVLVALLGALAAASLLHAIRRTGVAPEQAYYSAAARAWELALGGLLALGLAGRRLPRRSAVAAAWGGVAAIAAATVTFDAATAVPALPALLPALGAAALLAAGTSATAAAPTRALSLRPVRWVGQRSYAWYVWHWPVLIFAAAAFGPLSAAAGLAVVAGSLIPAIVTHRWIEEPIRRSNVHLRMPRITLAAAPAATALVIACGVALTWTISSPPILAAEQVEGAAQLRRTRTVQAAAAALRPTPRDADADRGRAYEDGCLVGANATRSPACVYGLRGSQTTVVLFGDSHAMQYFPALERIAVRHRWRLVELTKAGCPPPRVHVIFAPARREYPECDAWREHALRRIERERPALVVTTASVQYRVVAGAHRLGAEASMRALADGYAPTLRRLRSAAGSVAVLTDAPHPPWDVPACVSAALDDLRRCAFPRSRAVARAVAVSAAAQRVDGVRVIDLTAQFCLPDVCPAVIGDVLVYRNSGHVTATYAETLTPWLDRRLAALDAAPAGAVRLEATTRLQRSAHRVWPAPGRADADRSHAYYDGCLVPRSGTRSPTCAYGRRGSPTTVVLFGDSHALQYFPALDPIARARGWRLVQLTKAGCSPLGSPACRRWRTYALDRIEHVERPALVVAAGSTHYRPRAGRRASDRALVRGYARTLQHLTRIAPRVAVIRDSPRPPFDVPDCVATAMGDLRRCAFARPGGPDVIRSAAQRVDGVTLIDPLSRLCPRRLCPPVIGNVLVYRGAAHITATYARTMSAWLDRQLPRQVETSPSSNARRTTSARLRLGGRSSTSNSS